MTPFEKFKAPIPVWLLLVFVVVVLCGMTGAWLYWIDDAKWGGVIAGLFTGFVLFLFGLITQVFVFRKLDKYEQMGVKNLFQNRHEKELYRPIVKEARERVLVTGASATRFIGDFLDQESEDRTLVDALRTRRKLVVKILVPDDANMGADAKSRWLSRQKKVESLKEEFGDRFEIRRFSRDARHSFVVVDNDFVGGPVFEGDESQYAPAIHVDARTAYGRKHIEYFDRLWNSST
ncbi:hypothetical protein [Rhizobium leguminosarum]|uniref:hypothetical protein n=1 Tax=Rhizobium TaxID=379 RepID=UPI00140F5F07|nr:hypothetical protein [Rhizobium leguminosarum]QIO69333.1 hypothetical protein HA462_30045 [Rhizobium leguminosarum bv. trifolii]